LQVTLPLPPLPRALLPHLGRESGLIPSMFLLP